jgi:hypothetical protein
MRRAFLKIYGQLPSALRRASVTQDVLRHACAELGRLGFSLSESVLLD